MDGIESCRSGKKAIFVVRDFNTPGGGVDKSSVFLNNLYAGMPFGISVMLWCFFKRKLDMLF